VTAVLTLFGVVKVEAGFDPLKPGVHLRLHRLAPQIVTAQIIDVLAHADQLAGMIGLRVDDTRLPPLKLFQDFVHQFKGYFFRHVPSLAQQG
jgi:hypothetical protein